MVTLTDVAREAGVAVSTASRALTNPDRVGRATRERVQAVARRLGYQQLRAQRSQMLALLVSDITNPSNFGLIQGAAAQARAAGYTMVLGDTQEQPEVELTHADRLGASVDGLILAASRLSDEQLADIAATRPIVLCNRELPNVASLASDTRESSRQIIDHLAALGHPRAAYLGGPEASWIGRSRRRELAAAAASAGVDLVMLGPFAPTMDQGAAAADMGVASGAGALIAFNDLMAIGVLRRLAHRAIDVPGRISVVGYDDIFGADFCRPALTTVTTGSAESGRLLVDLLLEAIAGAPARRLTRPAHLQVRDSTGPGSRDLGAAFASGPPASRTP